MKKKCLAIILSSALVLSTALVGCQPGNQANSQANSQAGSEAGSQVKSTGVAKLNMWVHETDSPEGKFYKQRIAAFNLANKGSIEVTLTAIPRDGTSAGYDDRVNAAVTTKSLPDVLTCDGPNVAAEADAGILAPIDQYFDKSTLSDFNDDIVKQGTYKGKLYGLGAVDSSVLIYYNKKMFKDAGITAPTTVDTAWTWDQLLENAKKLTDKSKGIFGIDMHLDWNNEWNTYAFLPMIQSQGKNIVADDGKTIEGYMNSDASVNALTVIKKFVDAGVVSKKPVANSFEVGKSAMILSGTWEPGVIATNAPTLEYGIMPYPIYAGGKAVSPCGTWGYYMTTNCSADKQAAAVKLITFLTSVDSSVALYNANGMPCSRKTAASEIPDLQAGAKFSLITDQVQKTAAPRPLTPHYPVISDQFSKALANVCNGQDPKAALTKAISQATPELSK